MLFWFLTSGPPQYFKCVRELRLKCLCDAQFCKWQRASAWFHFWRGLTVHQGVVDSQHLMLCLFWKPTNRVRALGSSTEFPLRKKERAKRNGLEVRPPGRFAAIVPCLRTRSAPPPASRGAGLESA